MKKINAFFYMLMVFCAFAVYAQSVEWPDISHQHKPWSRWWWMGSAVNEADLTTLMQEYKQAGLGGLEITPIYGVRGFENQFVDYLSPRWVELLGHTLAEGERLDLGIDMATGTGWPFGGPWIDHNQSTKQMVHQKYTLKGGEQLDVPVAFIQEPMVRAIGKRVDISEIQRPVRSNENLQALALEQVKFRLELPLLALMAYSDQQETIELTSRVDEQGNLDWTAPQGNWTLYALFQGWHGKMVERAAPGGEGWVIDHFSGPVLSKYLYRFDESLGRQGDRGLRAYFNDSYEVDDASGQSDYTMDLFEQFETRRGYDVRLHLDALFDENPDDRGRRVLCDFRETISDLLLQEFTQPWRQWANQRGTLIRNQAHGSPANILDLYAASDIPETEGIEIMRFKFASSAAHVSDKPLVACEAATWLDEHFLATLADVKRATDRFFLGGVNHIVYHGTTYSPPDAEWPGWMFYASVNFAPSNSFWNDFPALNRYIARSQSFLQSGSPDNDILVYFPVYDFWSDKGRSILRHFRGGEQEYQNTDFLELSHTLLEHGYTFDFISDRQLTTVEYKNGELRSGQSRYKTILIPGCEFMPLEGMQKLISLANQGADVIFSQQMAGNVPGFGDLESRQQRMSGLLNALAFTQQAWGSVATVGEGSMGVYKDILSALDRIEIPQENLVKTGLRFVRRKVDDGSVYFIVNWSDHEVKAWLSLTRPAKSAALFDPMKGNAGKAQMDSKGRVLLHLQAGEAVIVRLYDRPITATTYAYFNPSGRAVALEGTWKAEFIKGGPNTPKDQMLDDLTSWTSWSNESQWFSGTVRYSHSFDRPDSRADAWQLDLGAVHNSARVWLNGVALDTLIQPPFRINIAPGQLQEVNELHIEVSNLQANRIAYLDKNDIEWKIFYNVNFPARRSENRNEKGLFDASHWHPRPSGLLGPVTLTPMQSVTPKR
jgi:hypothetical protein